MVGRGVTFYVVEVSWFGEDEGCADIGGCVETFVGEVEWEGEGRRGWVMLLGIDEKIEWDKW